MPGENRVVPERQPITGPASIDREVRYSGAWAPGLCPHAVTWDGAGAAVGDCGWVLGPASSLSYRRVVSNVGLVCGDETGQKPPTSLMYAHVSN